MLNTELNTEELFKESVDILKKSPKMRSVN